jgi:hypothetical protein
MNLRRYDSSSLGAHGNNLIKLEKEVMQVVAKGTVKKISHYISHGVPHLSIKILIETS